MKGLTTQRLLLRAVTREDTQAVFDNWASDDEVSRYLTWLPHKSTADTEAVMDFWIAEYEKDTCRRYVIQRREDGVLMGMIDDPEWVAEMADTYSDLIIKLQTMLFDSGFLWIVVAPLTFTMCHFAPLPFLAVYGICLLPEVIKAVFGKYLLSKDSWMKNLTIS